MRLHVCFHRHRLCCAWRCDSYDSFFQPVFLRHSRLATFPAPWGHGARLLLLRSPPPKSSALPNELSGSFGKCKALALGAGANLLNSVPRESRGRKGESKSCIKIAFR